jgi:hypothetical protein
VPVSRGAFGNGTWTATKDQHNNTKEQIDDDKNIYIFYTKEINVKGPEWT